MKNYIFALPLIAGLSIASCIKPDLEPKGSYMDERFFISKPYMVARYEEGRETFYFKCTEEGFISIYFLLGNFFQENGWRLQMTAIFHGDNGSKSFFDEVDEIGSEYYKAEYTDEYYGWDEYSYKAPSIYAFDGQIPFSFFQDTYFSVSFEITIMNRDEKYATLYSFGTASAFWRGNEGSLTVMDFGSITKYGN